MKQKMKSHSSQTSSTSTESSNHSKLNETLKAIALTVDYKGPKI